MGVVAFFQSIIYKPENPQDDEDNLEVKNDEVFPDPPIIEAKEEGGEE